MLTVTTARSSASPGSKTASNLCPLFDRPAEGHRLLLRHQRLPLDRPRRIEPGHRRQLGRRLVQGKFGRRDPAKGDRRRADPTRAPACWLFAGPGNATSSVFDHALCFDPALVNPEIPVDARPLDAGVLDLPAATTATSLENLGVAGLGYTSIDSLVPYSLDADIWKGGAPRLGAFGFGLRNQLLLRLAHLAADAADRPVPADPGPARLRQRLPLRRRQRLGDRTHRHGRAAAGDPGLRRERHGRCPRHHPSPRLRPVHSRRWK